MCVKVPGVSGLGLGDDLFVIYWGVWGGGALFC